MTAPPPDDVRGRSFGTLVDEFVSLTVAYFRQETARSDQVARPVHRPRHRGRPSARARRGLLALAAIRAIQAEGGRHLSGSLTFIPYFGGVLVAGVGAGWAVFAHHQVHRSPTHGGAAR